MPFSWRHSVRRCLIPTLVIAAPIAINAASDQAASLIDPANLELHNAKAEPAEYMGRKAVRITALDPKKESTMAVLRGTDFHDGTIEADIAVKITTPPGVRMPGFTGLAFRINPGGSGYENVYLRPKNALSEDQAMRNHALQYCYEPDYGWYKLRREWPYTYESWADIAPETWIHMRVDVAGRTARVSLNGKPALVVDGLKGPSLHSAVALWGYAGEESYFSNVRVTPASPLPIKNGSDVTGGWEVRIFSDQGPFKGAMQLTRQGDKVAGTWSGDLGDKKTVNGVWRNGHIELSFTADWPDGYEGPAGPAPAFLEGWIDDSSAKGRFRVQGRTDGPWQAQRQTQQSQNAP